MVQEINKADFEAEVLQSEKPVIVDFWAPWCGPCKMMGPVFEELSGDMADAKFVKVNVDENQDLAGDNAVQGIPTLIVFKGGKEVGRHTGFAQKEELQEIIKGML